MSPILKKMRDEGDDGVKYFNIAQPEYDYPHTFYLVSDKSPWDVRQLALVEHFTNIHIIRFHNSHHGIPFLKVALPMILNMTAEQLTRLENGRHLPVLFEMRLVGVLPTCKYLVRLAKKLIKKRLAKR